MKHHMVEMLTLRVKQLEMMTRPWVKNHVVSAVRPTSENLGELKSKQCTNIVTKITMCVEHTLFSLKFSIRMKYLQL
jgi:hypothetical protein